MLEISRKRPFRHAECHAQLSSSHVLSSLGLRCVPLPLVFRIRVRVRVRRRASGWFAWPSSSRCRSSTPTTCSSPTLRACAWPIPVLASFHRLPNSSLFPFRAEQNMCFLLQILKLRSQSPTARSPGPLMAKLSSKSILFFSLLYCTLLPIIINGI